ncbi:VOC family protein [Streptomyces sp. NPDC057298]|uniref:VOC family protein n=1 Tax=Streptomyces sp. NPDC057298 TaxID=3346091 RepID=UPI0036381F81
MMRSTTWRKMPRPVPCGWPRSAITGRIDDVGAEVARLLGLGAAEVSCWLQRHVLRAPGGHLLCVIPIHSDPDLFAATARIWK